MRLALPAGLLLLAAHLSTASAQPALPEGAVTRLGSPNLRQPGRPGSVVFSPDGKRVLTYGSGGLHAADAKTGATVREVRLSLLAARPAADGGSGTAVTDGGTVLAWDSTGEKTLFRSEDGATAAAFSPDGKLVAIGTSGGAVHVRDAATGKLAATLAGPKDAVRRLAVSADGKLLALAGEKSVGLWDVAAGKETRLLETKRDGNPFSVAFSPDGKTLVTGEYFGAVPVRVWDVATGKQRLAVEDMLPGYFPRAAAFAPDGKTFAHTGEGGGVFLRDAATGQEVRRLKTDHDTHGVAFSPDGKTLAASVSQYPAGAETRLFDVESGKELFDFPRHELGVEAVFFSADGKRAVTAGIDRTVRVWDATTGEHLFAVGERKIEFIRQRGLPCALSPDGKTLLVARGADVGVWDVAAGKELRTLRSPESPVVALAFAPSGKAFAALCVSAPVRPANGGLPAPRHAAHVLDLATGKASLSIPDLDGTVTQIQVSADGSLLALGAPDAPHHDGIRLFDAAGRKLSAFLTARGFGDPAMTSFAISPDEQTLVASADKLRCFDVASGKPGKTPDGLGGLSGLVFSPGGKHLAGSDHARWCVFEADTGKVVWERKHSPQGPRPVAFSPDGRRLLAGAPDGTAFIWELPGK